MNAKIFGFLAILLVLSIIPVTYAQMSIGEKAVQKSVEVIINSDGEVHVKHVIGSSNVPKQVDLIDGTISNLIVTDKQGTEKQFAVMGDSNNTLLVHPSQGDSIIEYSLNDVISQKDNVWTWSFRYLETTSFIFPELDLIFANERPVYLGEKKGITCHGCQMVLEYSINEPKILESVGWEDREFSVEIRSHSDIDKFVFDQPTKSIAFDVSEENRFVTIIIPLELLWEPYSVFLDDEKIYFNEYANNGTHVWLSMKPEMSGEITIIGTTVIPEFPIIAPLAIGFLIILVIPLIRKVNLH